MTEPGHKVSPQSLRHNVDGLRGHLHVRSPHSILQLFARPDTARSFEEQGQKVKLTWAKVNRSPIDQDAALIVPEFERTPPEARNQGHRPLPPQDGAEANGSLLGVQVGGEDSIDVRTCHEAHLRHIILVPKKGNWQAAHRGPQKPLPEIGRNALGANLVCDNQVRTASWYHLCGCQKVISLQKDEGPQFFKTTCPGIQPTLLGKAQDYRSRRWACGCH